jgi:nitronate monooxygenase
MANHLPNPFLTKLGMTRPIIQAPMTGYVSEEMVIAVSNAGGLGSIPATLLPPDAISGSIAALRKQRGPIAVSFLATPSQHAMTIEVRRGVPGWHRSLTNSGLSETCRLPQ